jgi:pantetheine-phosphate adenylyltransferase
MPASTVHIAVFPGAFDPLTHGHLDIIRRGAELFGRLVVGVGKNPEKTALFSAAERVAMIQHELRGLPNVEVLAYEGLTVEFVRTLSARVIIRGIRDTVDLRSELQAANTNLLVGGVETVFLMTSDQHALTSSTLIKQIVEIGGYDPARLLSLVPESVLRKLQQKFPQARLGAS